MVESILKAEEAQNSNVERNLTTHSTRARNSVAFMRKTIFLITACRAALIRALGARELNGSEGRAGVR